MNWTATHILNKPALDGLTSLAAFQSTVLPLYQGLSVCQAGRERPQVWNGQAKTTQIAVAVKNAWWI